MTTQLEDIVKKSFWFVVIGWAVVAFIFPDDWKIRYSARYLVSWDNITVSPHPTDCDWERSPLGNKGCHYERNITIEKWKQSNTREPMVSYDDGKTWQVSAPILALKAENMPIKYIFVDWNKVEEP